MLLEFTLASGLSIVIPVEEIAGMQDGERTNLHRKTLMHLCSGQAVWLADDYKTSVNRWAQSLRTKNPLTLD